MLSARLASRLRTAPRRIIARANSTSTPAKAAATTTTTTTTTSPAPAAAQAPNYPTTWSASQSARPTQGSGPRFEQVIMELQPQPLSAMQMIADEPVRLVHARKAVCDGGAYLPPSLLPPSPPSIPSPPRVRPRRLRCDSHAPARSLLLPGSGPLGHPKIFINLVRPPVCLPVARANARARR